MTVTPGLPSALHVMATVVRYEPKGLSKSAIYTFLGVATLPRFRGRAQDGPRTRGARRAANPLRLLPREIVIQIARFAYHAGYRAHWVRVNDCLSDDQPVQLSNDEEVAVSLAITDPDLSDGAPDWRAYLSPMVTGKTYYVEIRLTCAWWGTGLELLGLGHKFRLLLNHNGAGVDMAAQRQTGHIACFGPGPDATPMLSMPSLGVDSWSYCKDPVTMSVLVDMVRGCATFGLNGLAGPCVRFSGDAWRDGVQIATPPGCFPMAAVVGRSLGGRCVISCATPPTPPSMRETASHPMTVAEHLAAGSLRTAAGALIDAFLD